MNERQEETLGGARRRWRRVLVAYLSTGAALAILRVGLLVWFDHVRHYRWTVTDDYLLWGLYPEKLLGQYTFLGLITFLGSGYGYFLFWGSLVVLLSFLMATPVLFVGWVTRRRR